MSKKLTAAQLRLQQQTVDRVANLARYPVDTVVWAIMARMQQQVIPTKFQLDLLDWIEQYYGIRDYDN